MWHCRWQRLRYRRRVRGTPLADCWGQALPSSRASWREQAYLVCDAEMSSLDPGEGELLSLGWVVIEGGAIDLGSAAHHLVAASRSVGQSAGIHQLRDCDLQGAEPEAVVLARLCGAALGRVLVFHHAPLDLAYLDRASLRHFGAPLLLPTLDTLDLERRRLERHGTVQEQGGLTLAACRRRYGLPDYPAHNALVDALATAELLVAMAAHRGGLSRSGRTRPARLAELR
jgi:DNA polymerase III subunit epsilon